MCCTCLIICWSNTKRFLRVLVVFGKLFYFENFQKTVQPYFGDLSRGSSQSHAPVASLHRKFSWLTGGSKSQSQKRLRIFFSKIWVFRFLATQFGDLFASGSSSHEVYSESFATPFTTSSQVDLLVTKNT